VVVGVLTDYNTPQKLDRRIRWVIVCHNREGDRGYGKENAEELRFGF
jgi:hypothetical protein